MKTCEVCQKSFTPAYGNEKYCSESCRKKATDIYQGKYYESHYKQKYNPKRVDSLCWHCTKACGECSWSKNLTPVEGWTVEEVVRVTNCNGLPSYKVISCPEYIEGR